MFKVPEEFRVKNGVMKSDESYGNNGLFSVPFTPKKNKRQPGMKKTKSVLVVIASDGAGWEHVSVSKPSHDPSWRNMCFIKELFWGVEDVVIEFHPPKSDYINNHQHCLHLWRKSGTNDFVEMPPSILVGVK